ncbi:MAG: hypothetical protein ACOX3T_05845 [Bdellovibrionota bacterium]
MKPKVYKRSEHIVSRKNIDKDALKTMYRLINSGYKGYLVGGGVRDLLLNRKPKDFDIATDATPKQIKSIFRNCRIIGKRFKIAHVFFKDNKIIELSTFRDVHEVDIENVQTLAKDNIYGTEVTDAVRRDITINALYYDLSTFSIIDYVGGFKDLQRKIIRIIGNPTIKIIEDPVRLWRAIRHAAKCGFRIEPESRKAIIENRHLLSEIPAMRIHDELKKDFSSGYSYQILKLAEKLKVLDLILPELGSTSTCLSHNKNETSLALICIDNWVQKGQAIPITAIFSVFSISVKKSLEKNKNYNELFENEDEIDAFVKTLFTKLFVPKKEKEVIISTIKLWKKFISKEPDSINVRSLARRAPLVELKYLVLFTNNSKELEDIINEALKLKTEAQDKKIRESKLLNKKPSFFKKPIKAKAKEDADESKKENIIDKKEESKKEKDNKEKRAKKNKKIKLINKDKSKDKNKSKKNIKETDKSEMNKNEINKNETVETKEVFKLSTKKNSAIYMPKMVEKNIEKNKKISKKQSTKKNKTRSKASSKIKDSIKKKEENKNKNENKDKSKNESKDENKIESKK